MNKLKAQLRCCASCEWIYKLSSDAREDQRRGCPKCKFVSYSARFVHGEKCYKYAITQEPWIRRKIADFQAALIAENLATNPAAQEYQRRQMVRGHSFSLND